MELGRRDLMAAAAAGALALPARGWALPAAPATTPPLATDIGRLKRVLVHSFKASDFPVDILGGDVLPNADSDVVAAEAQHAGLNAALSAQGAEVVELVDALDAAIAATRPSGVFAAWLNEAFPRFAVDPDRVTAAMLLGRDPATQFTLDATGDYRHLANSSLATIFTRDSAFMSPKGLVICNSISLRRRRENMLLRFVYAHSPLLKDVPVALDMVEEGLIVEGGDATIVAPDLMFLGTGNRTDPRAAPFLAKRLDMDVLAVTTVERDFLTTVWPGSQPPPAFPLRILLLHLDTYFTMVARNHALTVPYLLEQAHAEDNPLARFLRGSRTETRLSEDEAGAALGMLKAFGQLTLYRRGTGKAEKLPGVKLVDYLRKQGWRFTWVGGARPDAPAAAFRHFMTTTYPELRRQGANIVQAAPGRVIAYDGNPATRAALEADGIAVDRIAARELWPWDGGPHCLTQPLARG
jgi:arginine deiminase